MVKLEQRLDEMREQLRRSSRRLTGPRRTILEVMARQPHPLTIREVFDKMQECGCDLATVYRSMHLLRRMGMVQRYDFGDGAARFEWVRHEHGGHHHHLICSTCAVVVELDGCLVSRLDAEIASSNGFKQVTHRLEFFGICPRCQNQTLSKTGAPQLSTTEACPTNSRRDTN